MVVHIRVVAAPHRAVVGVDIARALPVVLHLPGTNEHRARAILLPRRRVKRRVGVLFVVLTMGENHCRLIVAGPRDDRRPVAEHGDHTALEGQGSRLKCRRRILHPVQLKVLPDHDSGPVTGVVHLRRRYMHMHPQQIEVGLARHLHVRRDVFRCCIGEVQRGHVAGPTQEHRAFIDEPHKPLAGAFQPHRANPECGFQRRDLTCTRSPQSRPQAIQVR